MRWLIPCLIPVLTGCGLPAIWRLELTVQTAGGAQSPAHTDFELRQLAGGLNWIIGGCNVPLAAAENRARLNDPPWTCSMTESKGVPFADLPGLGYTFSQGDSLSVRRAEFQLVDTNSLDLNVDLMLSNASSPPPDGFLFMALQTQNAKYAKRQ